jgi:putative spermidine/putrescine transport system permease protein
VAPDDFLEPLRLGVFIAVIVTLVALALAIPLGYALARLAFPGRALGLLLFLLPQAFPQRPVFASDA